MTLNRSIDQRSNALCAAKSKFSVKIEIELNCMWFWCIISLLNTQSIHFKWLLNEFSDIKADIMSSWTTSLLALSCDWSIYMEFCGAHGDSVTISIQWCKVIQKNGIQMNSLWCLVQSIVSRAISKFEKWTHTMHSIQRKYGNALSLSPCLYHDYSIRTSHFSRNFMMNHYDAIYRHERSREWIAFIEFRWMKKTGWTNIRDLVSN